MHAETCGIHMTADGSYFDITHSFKVGPSTYHVLGLRKDYPTYNNNYYIFNCTLDGSQSPGHAFESLPAIHSSRSYERRSLTTTRTRKTETRFEAGSKEDRNRPRSALQQKMESDTTAMKKVLTEIMKSERQTLVTSLREEMNVDKQTLLRSIEKETEVFTQAISTAKNEKQAIVRLLEEHKRSLESTYEKHVSTTVSSIELLKKTIIETIDAQHERLRVLDQFQLTLSETIEREVEKTMVKHLEIFRSASVNVSTIQLLQSTLIQAFEQRYTTSSNDNSNQLKQLLAEQQQFLTNSLKKQQESISLELNTIKQSQSTVVEIMNRFSTTKGESRDNDLLKQLFLEQRQYLSDLIGKQHQTIPLELIKETVCVAIKEHTSLVATDSTTTTKTTTIIPTSVVHEQSPIKVSIQTSEFAHVYAKLLVGGNEYKKELHTLCQRDSSQVDVVNCFVAPPLENGPLALTIYAKTRSENEYRAAISIQMPPQNITQGITFPQLYQSFEDHQCILIQPFRRFLQLNEQVLIHMVLPGARRVKIRNGDNDIFLNQNEFRNGTVKAKVQVRGDLIVYGHWDDRPDSPVCAFEMDKNSVH